MLPNSVAQKFLFERGFYKGLIDNDFGSRSQTAMLAWSNKIPGQRGWATTRIRVALNQAVLAYLGFYGGVVDGLWGARSQVALEKWQDHVSFVEPKMAVHPTIKPIWPYQRDLEKFYGKVGENQTRLTSPYPLYLDWAVGSKITSFMCHEKIHDASLRAMNRVLDVYGPEKIHELGLDQFGGCLNVRPMRNGTAWSTHAWGIAYDWDADRNQLRWGRDLARMAKPEYAPFLDAWEEEGFVSLGRARNFDWMHIQAARLG